MSESNTGDIAEQSDNTGPKIIQTDVGAKDGQNKCPKCGSTDISLNSSNGLLRCAFCRHEFEPQKAEEEEADLYQLAGQVIGSGAQDIIADVNEILTLKCSSCGAEVIIDTREVTQARCHWCRNTLSVNQQIPNGSVPDMVLPFKIKKEAAQAEIEGFVGKRKFFAHPKFKNEFTTKNVMGVYLPYMVIDINAHANLAGQGERLVRRYSVGSGNDKETRYDADLYQVERDFDLVIDNLTVESSSDKLQRPSDKTNNIINSIMPFDTENSVKWNANYIKGYTSEKRDTNIEQLRGSVNVQAKDIVRHKANETLKEYDRGVRWSNERMEVKGQKWKSAYLPIWLYSYQQVRNGGKNLLHYVAVNARTKETMGSVPIHTPKLLLISLIVEILGVLAAILTGPLVDSEVTWLFALAGPVYFAIIYARYRNTGARHAHEKETKAEMANIKKADKLLKRLTGLKDARMQGANNLSVGHKAGSAISGK